MNFFLFNITAGRDIGQKGATRGGDFGEIGAVDFIHEDRNIVALWVTLYWRQMALRQELLKHVHRKEGTGFAEMVQTSVFHSYQNCFYLHESPLPLYFLL